MVISHLQQAGPLTSSIRFRAPYKDGVLVQEAVSVIEEESCAFVVRNHDGLNDRVCLGKRFPATVLTACAGKPILEVINHPVTRERYNAADVIERAFWDDEAHVSVFEVRRAA